MLIERVFLTHDSYAHVSVLFPLSTEFDKFSERTGQTNTADECAKSADMTGDSGSNSKKERSEETERSDLISSIAPLT